MNKRILFWIFIGAVIFTLASSAYSQETPTLTPQCPPEMVCMSRTAALTAAKAATERDAAVAKVEALEAALAAQKQLTADVQTKLAYEQGRNSALEEMAVHNRAVIEAMIPMLRKKKIGLLNIF